MNSIVQINLVRLQHIRRLIWSQLYNTNNNMHIIYVYTLVLVDRYFNDKRRHNDIILNIMLL